MEINVKSTRDTSLTGNVKSVGLCVLSARYYGLNLTEAVLFFQHTINVGD